MSVKRSVIQVENGGAVRFSEELAATAEVKPGYAVLQSGAGVAHQSNAGGNYPRRFAVERDELGTGIDNTFQGEGTGSAFYASGDTVKVATCPPGTVVTAFLASGYVVARGDRLQYHTGGLLRPLEASQTPVGVADDVVSAQALVPTAIRVEVM